MTDQPMTTAGLQAKVALRRAWFEAHPNQPMPEGREQVDRLIADIEAEARVEWEATFDLRWRADMRAIKRWQDAHPGNELVWPDHADLVVWLMEQLDG